MTPGQNANASIQAKPIVILGAGGHARVLLSILNMQRRKTLAVLDDNSALHGQRIARSGPNIIGHLEMVSKYEADAIELINAIGSADRPKSRQSVYEKMLAKGYHFATLWHESAIIAYEAFIQPSTQIMASATIQAGAQVYANALINTGAIIDHDTTIGEHTHIAPGVTVCGGVSIGQGCHIGTGATIIQGITLGNHVVVGAGATVLKDIPDGLTVVGSPAKPAAE